MKDYEIGEEFDFEEVKLRVEKCDNPVSCENCFFKKYRTRCSLINEVSCTGSSRTDGISVKFVKVEEGTIQYDVSKATRCYSDYRMYCSRIAKEAQKYIDWNDDVNCEYYPSDGLCLNLETDRAYVCPVNSFFSYIKDNNLTSITEDEFKLLCV